MDDEKYKITSMAKVSLSQCIRNDFILSVGDKLYPANNSEEDCKTIALQLEQAGYRTRISQHNETKKWSVAIIEK